MIIRSATRLAVRDYVDLDSSVLRQMLCPLDTSPVDPKAASKPAGDKVASLHKATPYDPKTFFAFN